MKLKSFSKVLIALCLVLFVIGGIFVNGNIKSNTVTIKSVAIIGGGVMEDSVNIGHFIW